MGRKKVGAGGSGGGGSRLICFYCDRNFDDEGVMCQHQRAKHFRCDECGDGAIRGKCESVQGLVIHTLKVHGKKLTKVPNALRGRESPENNVYGMDGCPEWFLREKGLPIPEAEPPPPEPSSNKPPPAPAPAVAPLPTLPFPGGLLPPPGPGMPPPPAAGLLPPPGPGMPPPPGAALGGGAVASPAGAGLPAAVATPPLAGAGLPLPGGGLPPLAGLPGMPPLPTGVGSAPGPCAAAAPVAAFPPLPQAGTAGLPPTMAAGPGINGHAGVPTPAPLAVGMPPGPGLEAVSRKRQADEISPEDDVSVEELRAGLDKYRFPMSR
mmetsp:Transcript_54611/g.130304  ORF Transcript_54611/g.130304 Transcript_54611/m.130304 type:complete len:322 (-) Transcript_54611:53-1018(-)